MIKLLALIMSAVLTPFLLLTKNASGQALNVGD